MQFSRYRMKCVSRLRFLLPLLSFRFRFRLSARSALPFGFRLRSSLRFLFAFAQFPRAQLFRFLPFRVFRFAFRFRFPLAPLRFPLLSLRSASLLFSSFLFSSRFYPIPENDTSSRSSTVIRPLCFLLRGFFASSAFSSFELHKLTFVCLYRPGMNPPISLWILSLERR